MPRGDRTGPDGLGPMTGRRAGYCAGYSVPGYMNDVPGWGRSYGYGRGARWGYGYGRGYRWGAGYGRGYYPADVPPAVDEKTFLENELKYLEQQQENLRKRLNDLTTKKGED
ncbi:MAG: DUF5320 domain-containing protein [Bacteroidales bacterium]|nr:DUF5320 domain-containing protein [Bacteroidales bacterium]